MYVIISYDFNFFIYKRCLCLCQCKNRIKERGSEIRAEGVWDGGGTNKG